MKKIAIIVLVTVTLGFSAAPAYAWSQFIIHLAKTACQGKSASFKNGCYAYIEPRVNNAYKKEAALNYCKKTRCEKWYKPNGEGAKVCIEGCNYLYRMGD
jgi:hypothetical protein